MADVKGLIALLVGLVSVSAQGQLAVDPAAVRFDTVPAAVVAQSGQATAVDCLALNIYHEARGEPLKGQVAVAQVVLNRVAHVRFPNEVCAVIKDGGEWPRGFCQFSWWCDGRSDAPLESKAWRESLALADEVLSGAHGDPTRGALWYHATSVAPTWRRDFDRTGRIGDHIFYRPRRRNK